MSPRRLAPALPCLALLALAACLLAAASPARAQPDPVSGLYAHESDPRATVKLMLAPSEKYGAPVGRVWGVVSFKDPRRPYDSCTFEFQSTLKSDVITCRDAMNPGCNLQLRLMDRGVVLDVAPECQPVYCKGQGAIPQGLYARVPDKPGKKKRHP